MKSEERPWGSWTIIQESDEKVVKLITVKPGAMLSLQTHANRTEQWHGVDRGLLAYSKTKGFDSVLLMRPGTKFTVFPGDEHRLINPTDKELTLIEIITGDYDEEDITRIHDAYGRAD